MRDYRRKTAAATSQQTLKLADAASPNEDEIELRVSEEELSAMGPVSQEDTDNYRWASYDNRKGSSVDQLQQQQVTNSHRKSDGGSRIETQILLEAKHAANFERRRKTQMQAFLNRVKLRQS